MPPIKRSSLRAVRYDELTGEWSTGRAKRVRGISLASGTPLRCCGPTIGRGASGFVGERVIPPYCPPPAPPNEEQRTNAYAIKWAMKEALREAPIISTQSSPVEHPGYRNRRRNQKLTIVVHDGDPDGATAIARGFSGPFGSILPAIVNIGPGLEPVEILGFICPDSMVGVVEEVIITSNTIDLSQVFFSAWRSGDLVQEEFHVTEALRGVPLTCPLKAGDRFALSARMAGFGAFLLRIELNIWLNPVITMDDTLQSRVLKNNPSFARPGECT